MYFDFDKVFDSVPHQRLLDKVSVKILKSIKGLLSNRRQIVKIKGMKLVLTTVLSWIP